MNAITNARQELVAALRAGTYSHAVTVPDDPASATSNPPTIAVMPPSRIEFATFNPSPTSVTFPVVVIVPANDRAVETLAVLVPEAAAQIHQATSGAAEEATATSFNNLPAYEMNVEYPLTEVTP